MRRPAPLSRLSVSDPDNPFNQVTVAYDATKADKVAALQADQEAKAARYVGTARCGALHDPVPLAGRC